MPLITNARHPQFGGNIDSRLGDIGPFVDSNDNLYVVARPVGGALTLGVYKSTDDGSTWNEIDSVGRPASIAGGGQVVAFSVFQVGTVLHIAATSTLFASGMSNLFTVEYHTFNLSDAGSNPDTWQIKNEAVASPAITATLNFVDIAVRSDGDVIITHQTPDETIMGNVFRRVGYSRREGGSWTASIAIEPGGSLDQTLILCVLGSNDRIHLFWREPEPHAATLRPDNSLSTTILAAFDSFSRPFFYSDGSTGHVILLGEFISSGRRVFTKNFVETSNDIANTEVSAQVENVGNKGETFNKGIVRVPNSDETHVAYLGGPTGQPVEHKHATRTGTGAWGTPDILRVAHPVSNWWHHHPDQSRIGYVYCDHDGSPVDALYYDELSLGAPVEFFVEQATESNVASEVELGPVALSELFVELATEQNIAAEVQMETEGVPLVAGYITLDGVDDSVDTPDSVQLSITGPIDIRICAAADDWTHSGIGSLGRQTLLAKYEETGDQRSWRLQINQNPIFHYIFSRTGTTGTTATIEIPIGSPLPLVDGAPYWFRFTDDAPGVFGVRVFEAFWSEDPPETDPDAVSWTSLGVEDGLGFQEPNGIFDSTAPVRIGLSSGNEAHFAGKVFYAEIRSGIDGTKVANPDFRDDSQADWSLGSGTDDHGNVWTLQNDAFWTEPVSATALTVEVAHESNVAHEVKLGSTGINVEQAFERNIATEVVMTSPDQFDLSTDMTISIDMTEGLAFTEETPARGLGVPRTGDHRPRIYNPKWKVIRR
jgi:hypothetical protein